MHINAPQIDVLESRHALVEARKLGYLHTVSGVVCMCETTTHFVSAEMQSLQVDQRCNTVKSRDVVGGLCR